MAYRDVDAPPFVVHAPFIVFPLPPLEELIEQNLLTPSSRRTPLPYRTFRMASVSHFPSIYPFIRKFLEHLFFSFMHDFNSTLPVFVIKVMKTRNKRGSMDQDENEKVKAHRYHGGGYIRCDHFIVTHRIIICDVIYKLFALNSVFRRL